MAAGESTTADFGDLLTAIVARLIDQVKDANESNCYFSIDPNSVNSDPGDHRIVVSPLSGSWSETSFVGAGLSNLITDGGVKVKIHLPTLSDQTGRDVAAIQDESLSIIRKANAVLAALCPADGQSSPWVPRLPDSTTDLCEPLRPVGYLLEKTDQAVRAIELDFRLTFDWSVAKR